MQVFFKVGRMFGYKGVMLKVVKNKDCVTCDGCYFQDNKDCLNEDLVCVMDFREDKNDVIFQEVK